MARNAGVAAFLFSVLFLACKAKDPVVFSGRYLAERSEDGGSSWAERQGGFLGRGSTSLAAEENFYAQEMFDAGVAVCGEAKEPDRAKVRVRGYYAVKEGKAPLNDAELRAAVKFDLDCAAYTASRK
ncbi:MAG: hypothetical protein IOD12_17085 [Silvanigrellales bacterium]|nr:hypothetical protein [Silvanigrellales bacterium]